MPPAKNVLGGPLETCSNKPLTGFYRDGCCNTGAEDLGVHTVCAVMTEDFLKLTLEQGNDLITPVPQFGFPSLRIGDRWCVCAERWAEALEFGVAPPIVLEATHEATLNYVALEKLKRFAVKA